MDLNNLTEQEHDTLKDLIKQANETTEKRYVYKNPVGDMSALKNIVDPEEGETRQVLTFLPKLISFTYTSSAVEDGIPSNGSGTWLTNDLSLANGALRNTTTNSANIVIASRGGGILTNGTGSLGTIPSRTKDPSKRVILNFDNPYSDASVSYDNNYLDNAPIGMKAKGANHLGLLDIKDANEIHVLSPNMVYRGGVSVRSNPEAAAKRSMIYCGYSFLDFNGKVVTSTTHQHYGLAKLAQDLNLGTDTWMYIVRDGDFQGNINPQTEWKMGHVSADAYALRRGPMFWDHSYNKLELNELGEDIPFSDSGVLNPGHKAGFGYSRHYAQGLWDNVDQWEQANDGTGPGNWNGYTNVWRHPIKTSGYTHNGYQFTETSTSNKVPEGTWLSHNWHGGTYKYCFSGGHEVIDSSLMYTTLGYIGGVDYSGHNRSYNIPPGACGALLMMLENYQSDNLNQEMTASNFHVEPDPACTLYRTGADAIPEHTYCKIRRVYADETDPVPKVESLHGSTRLTTSVKIVSP